MTEHVLIMSDLRSVDTADQIIVEVVQLQKDRTRASMYSLVEKFNPYDGTPTEHKLYFATQTSAEDKYYECVNQHLASGFAYSNGALYEML